MRLKRTLTLMLAVILIAALSLSGCTGSGTPADAGSGDPTPTETEPADSGDAADPGDSDGGAGDSGAPAGNAVTLTFMGWEASPLETEAVRNGIAAFEAQYPNITVSYTPTLGGSEYTAKLLSTYAGGSMPDVMFMQSADYRTFAARGVISEITDRFSDEYSLDDFLPSARTIMEIDSHVFGIQSCIVTPVLYYNKSVFDDAGVAYPPTEAMQWEDFRQMAIQLTDGDIIGVYGVESTGSIANAFLESNGASLYKNDYNEANINSPEAREVYNALRDLRYVDEAALDATTLENIGMSASHMLQTGRVAMVVDGSWALQELAALDFDIGLAPVPYFKTPTNTAQAHLHSIASTSANQDEAWEFLKFLSGMDYQGALVREGLWMPNRISMYEEDAVAQWYSESVHGEYIDFLDYFINANVDVSAMAKSTKCGDIVTEETDIFYKDGGDVDTMLQNMETRINEALASLEE